MELYKMFAYLVIPRQIDFFGTLLLGIIVIIGLYLAYSINVLLEDKKSKKKNKINTDELKQKMAKYIKNKTVKNYNMRPIKISGKTIEIEHFIIITLIMSIAFAIFISLTLKIEFFITIPALLACGIVLIDKIAFMRYEKIKKAFEAAFEQTGLVIASGTAQRKQLVEIYDDLINIQKFPISEEFFLVKQEFKKTDMHNEALELLKRRYSDSMFIPRVADFLKLYNDEKRDITSIIEVNSAQAQGFVINRKESENAVKPLIYSIYVVIGIVYAFFIASIFVSENTLKYYKNNVGTFIILNVVIAMGIYILNYMSMAIIKDDCMERIKE